MAFLFLPASSYVLFGSLVLVYICYDIWRRSYWRRHGIRSPPSLPVFGNTYEWRMSQHEKYEEYSKTYRNFFGVYNFNTPILVISDLDAVKNILVKDFQYFYNRPNFPLVNRPMDKSLFFLRDSRWKKVRNVTSPSFSANKMKKMSLLVNEKADRLVENIGKEQAKRGFVECKQLYGSFVMDSISECAFGLDVDSQNNPGHPFVDHAKQVIQSGFIFSPLIAIAAIFPWLAGIFRYFNIGILKGDSLRFFGNIATQAMAIRRGTANKENKRVDFLQLMVDATREKHEDGTNQKEDIDDDLKVHHENDKDSVPRDAKLSKPIDDDEFTAQAMFFLFGGYENTSSLCGFSSYFLARNPESQDKLIKEIDEMTPTSGSVNYTTIAKMTYLDHVIRETLRLYPIAPLTSRVCTKEYDVNGFTIPKGMQVDIPIYTIQRDPEIWPEPEKFIPERFTKENLETMHPYSWIPFGSGPRMCIGMRFAVMETKIALVRVLREFRLETCPQTEIPPKTGSNGLVTPKNGIALRVVRRN